MKKFLLKATIIVSMIILPINLSNAHEPYVTPHKPYTSPHTGYTVTTQSSTNSGGSYTNAYPVYRPVCRSSGAVLSSGVNYITRDIGTGEIKQVVQVAPPPAYMGRCYY